MGYPSISKCKIFNVRFSTSGSHCGSCHHWLLQVLDGQTSCHSEMAHPVCHLSVLTFQIRAGKHYLWGMQSNFMIQSWCFPQRQALKRYLVSYRNVTEIQSLSGNPWLAQRTRKERQQMFLWEPVYFSFTTFRAVQQAMRHLTGCFLLCTRVKYVH